MRTVNASMYKVMDCARVSVLLLCPVDMKSVLGEKTNQGQNFACIPANRCAEDVVLHPPLTCLFACT
jgi:hypothetical protein